MGVADILTDFALHTTAHGLNKAWNSRLTTARVIWTLLFLAAFSFLMVQYVTILMKYFSYPTSVAVSMEYGVLQFPSVTVCNKNPLRVSKLPEPMQSLLQARFGHQLGHSHESAFAEYFGNRSQELETHTVDPEGLLEDVEGLLTEDYPTHSEGLSEVVQELSSENNHTHSGDGEIQHILFFFLAELYTGLDWTNSTKMYGHRLEDLVQECTWRGESCTKEDWQYVHHPTYGNCYIFNSGRKREALNLGRTGHFHGLSLTLFVEQDEYVGHFTHSAGARISLHPQLTHGFPEKFGFDVAPGFETSVAVRVRHITRLPEPHGDCAVDGTDISYFSHFHGDRYNLEGCMYGCIIEKMVAACGCIHPEVAYFDFLFEGIEICANHSSEQCAIEIYDHVGSPQTCQCPLPCDDTQYVTDKSTARWPSHEYEKIFFQEFTHKYNVSKELMSRATSAEELSTIISENFARVNIYFQQLNYETITETAAYNVSQMFTDIGGNSGLCLGMSLITGVEVIELLILIISHFCCRNKVESSVTVAPARQINVTQNSLFSQKVEKSMY